MEIRSIIEKLESEVTLPKGNEERFNGYGLMGLPFETGHILALRRIPASSIGSGYTSVWHRSPQGSWSFYADVSPQLSCTRYFGGAADFSEMTKIDINWKSEYQFSVHIESCKLTWDVELSESWKTVLMSQSMKYLPSVAWKNNRVLKIMGLTAGKLLGVGKIGLSGITPNRQKFIANPYRLWEVKTSSAEMNGIIFGEPGSLSEQAHLQDFWIPQKGIFALAKTFFEPFDSVFTNQTQKCNLS